MPKGKTDLKDQEETKTINLEDVVPDRKVTIGGNLLKKEEAELIETLAKNKDIIQHCLDNNPRIKPKKQ
jgi:hypothetical protein